MRSALSDRSLRQIVDTMKTNDNIEVHWGDAREGKRHRWTGVVRSVDRESYSAQVLYDTLKKEVPFPPQRGEVRVYRVKILQPAAKHARSADLKIEDHGKVTEQQVKLDLFSIDVYNEARCVWERAEPTLENEFNVLIELWRDNPQVNSVTLHGRKVDVDRRVFGTTRFRLRQFEPRQKEQ